MPPASPGPDLSAYICAGIRSDHECTTLAEAEEKLFSGMFIMLREGSAARNLTDLLPLVTLKNSPPVFIRLRRPPPERYPPGRAYRLHAEKSDKGGSGSHSCPADLLAQCCPLLRPGRPGAIAPGYRADIAGLDEPRVTHVFKDGRLVAKDGDFLAPHEKVGQGNA